MRDSTNKSPIKLRMQWKLNRHGDFFTNGENLHGKWGKPTWQKPYWVILRSLLPRIHYYQNKRLQGNKSQYFIPTYS